MLWNKLFFARTNYIWKRREYMIRVCLHQQKHRTKRKETFWDWLCYTHMDNYKSILNEIKKIVYLFWTTVLGMDIRGTNRVSVLSNRVSVFQVYQNQPHSDYMKVRFTTGSGSIGFGPGLVNLQRTGTTQYTFGFGFQSIFWFKSTWFLPIL